MKIALSRQLVCVNFPGRYGQKGQVDCCCSDQQALERFHLSLRFVAGSSDEADAV
jgi:hypothetical protein